MTPPRKTAGPYTEPGWNLHTAAEISIDDFQANRAPDRVYRTSPLNGLWTHQKGGFNTTADSPKEYQATLAA